MNAAIEVLSLLLVGSIAGAELGSWCCVQPVVARLPYEQYVAAEQGMLRTFGRIMPVLMPLSGVLAVALVVVSRAESDVVLWLRIAAALGIALTVVTTLTVNVPINTRTTSWQSTNDSSEWQQLRQRWHFFQGVRGALRGRICVSDDCAGDRAPIERASIQPARPGGCRSTDPDFSAFRAV